MASVSMIFLCASALFVQTTYAQCFRAPAPAARVGCAAPALAPMSWAPRCGTMGYGNIIASNSASSVGGGLGVTSSSSLSPKAISVLSENDISGGLAATGNLPVLAAVALEGSVDTSGSVGTTHSCGNGQVGITAESLAAAGLNVAGFGGGYGAASAAEAAAAAAAANIGACGTRAFAPCGCY